MLKEVFILEGLPSAGSVEAHASVGSRSQLFVGPLVEAPIAIILNLNPYRAIRVKAPLLLLLSVP